MGKKRIVELQFPLAGINSKYAYRQQPPFTTPDALNMRPAGAIKNRDRGGSRPGMDKYFYEELGSGSPVRMLSEVDIVKDDGVHFWTDNFLGASLSPIWSTASWVSTQPSVVPPGGIIVDTASEVASVVRDALSDFEETGSYQTELFVAPYNGQHWGTYKLFVRMDDTTPDVTADGTVIELDITGATGAYSGRILNYASGIPTEYLFTTTGSDGYPAAGIFRCLVAGDNIKVYWRGVQLITQTVAAPAGKRFGFGLHCTVDNGVCLADYFRIQYTSNVLVNVNRRILTASAGGSFYTDSSIGQLTAVSSSLTLASDHHIQATQRLQKLYIADYSEPRAAENDGDISVDTVLTSVSIGDFTILGISTDDDVVEITNGTGSITDGTYEIASIAVGGLTMTATTGTGTCTFNVMRGAKIYTPVTDTLSLYLAEAGKGTVPVGPKIIAHYRDRIVMADAHLWYMSRQGNPLDFDYSADSGDTQRAVAAQTSDAGRLGEVITALIPFSDDYMLFGCENSVWVLRGDPAWSGQIDNLSRNIGILSNTSYCLGPSGEIIFLSRDGLYIMPNATTPPQSVSSETLPNDLLNIDPKLFDILMAYDVKERGVHIYNTPKAGGSVKHWWFDWDQKSTWPVDVPVTFQPTSILSYKAHDTVDGAVLLGCRDGYVRKFHQNFVSDGATAITSNLIVGPIRTAKSNYRDGKVIEVIGALAEGSGDVTADVLIGKTHEATVRASAFATHTLTDGILHGLNRKFRPRARGGSFAIKLSNAEDFKHWSYERLTVVTETSGKERVY
jgi:hypothetical protein